MCPIFTIQTFILFRMLTVDMWLNLVSLFIIYFKKLVKNSEKFVKNGKSLDELKITCEVVWK